MAITAGTPSIPTKTAVTAFMPIWILKNPPRVFIIKRKSPPKTLFKRILIINFIGFNKILPSTKIIKSPKIYPIAIEKLNSILFTLFSMYI